jgi:hypothetical protein
VNDLSPSCPPQTVASVCDDLRFEAIIEATELAGSYAISAREAARRGERLTLGLHLRQLRLAALQTFNELADSHQNAEAG